MQDDFLPRLKRVIDRLDANLAKLRGEPVPTATEVAVASGDAPVHAAQVAKAQADIAEFFEGDGVRKRFGDNALENTNRDVADYFDADGCPGEPGNV